MSGALGRRASPVWLIGLVLALTACGGSASTQSGQPGGGGGGGGGTPRTDSAPPRDAFTGSIASGTGRHSGARGGVRVYLHPQGTGQRRAVRMVFIGQCGASSTGCVKLDGIVNGTLTRLPGGLPDTGHVDSVSGTGRLGPLGQVTVRGVVAGTGFISHAHELMKLTLTTPTGGVKLAARSGIVNGFSSP